MCAKMPFWGLDITKNEGEMGNESLKPDRDPVADLADDMTATVEALLTAGSVGETLARLIELAVSTIDGCDYAGIFVSEGGVISTPPTPWWSSSTVSSRAPERVRVSMPCRGARRSTPTT